MFQGGAQDLSPPPPTPPLRCLSQGGEANMLDGLDEGSRTGLQEAVMFLSWHSSKYILNSTYRSICRGNLSGEESPLWWSPLGNHKKV